MEDITHFGMYQGHRFGPRSSRKRFYLDVMMPGLRWCIRDREDESYRRWPRKNTWRSAYNTLRGMSDFGSHYGYEEAKKG
jgi:hypothetical protein